MIGTKWKVQFRLMKRSTRNDKGIKVLVWVEYNKMKSDFKYLITKMIYIIIPNFWYTCPDSYAARALLVPK